MKYIIGAVVVVAVAVGGYFAFSNQGAPQEGAAMKEKGDSAMTAEEGAFTGDLFALGKRGGDFRCTFSHTSDVATSEGTVYISGERIRGDFESQTQGIAVESHMLALPGVIYSWSPLAPTGVKLPRAAIEGNGNAATSGQYADLRQAYTYDCKAWSVDEAVFTVPSSVTFVEVQT